MPRPYRAALTGRSVGSRPLSKATEQGGSWRADSDLAILAIEYSFSAAKPGIALRREKNRLRATINRPVETIGSLRPGKVAEVDVHALLEALARKQGLGRPPSLE